MKKAQKVFVAGPPSAVRSALVRRLRAQGLNTDQIDTLDDTELNLCNQVAVRKYLRKTAPDQIYIASDPSNSPDDSERRRGSYMAESLLGPVSLIHEAVFAGVKKVLFIASNQVYSGCSLLPIAEEDLASARPDQTRAPLAIAHTAGIRLCEAYTHEFGEILGLTYRSVVVGNIFGPGDVYDAHKAGELLALMRHIHQAKLFKLSSVSIRSNGLKRADWLYVDDMAEACVNVLEMPDHLYGLLTRPDRSQLNLGSGQTYTMMELAQAVARVVGYRGVLKAENSSADESQEFILDTHRMRSTGWEAQVELELGLTHMYQDYIRQGKRLTSA